jgi:hypothetical protein
VLATLRRRRGERLFQDRRGNGHSFIGYMVGYKIVSPRGATHADPDALENRARPLLPCAPAASDVFAYSEHAARRAGCTGACLVGKVKDHSVP